MLDQGRTFQSRISSRLDAKEAAAKAPVSRQREKGLWNFLTWSFFISQIVAAQQAAAASATEAETAADDAAHTGAQPADAPVSAVAAEQSSFDPAEVQQAVALPAQSLEPGAPTLITFADKASVAGDAEAFGDPEAAQARGQFISADFLQTSSDSGTVEVPGVGQTLDGVLEPVTGIVGDVGQVVDAVLEPVLSPVLGLVGNAVEDVAPALEQVVAPVADLTASVIELVEPVLDPIIMPTAAVLEEVLQTLDPIIDPVTGIAAGATALLGEAVEPVTALVGDVVEPLVPVINDLTAPVGELVSPLLAPLGSVLAPVTAPLLAPIAEGISLLDPLTGQGSESVGGSAEQPLSALLGLGSGEPILIGPVAAAAGSLDLPALPVAGGIDDLFVGTSYTDYNLALQSDASAGAQPAAAGVAALDTLVSGIENIALIQHDSHDAGSDAPAAGLPNILGGGLRGLEWAGL
jgi:hypothetical protein